MRYTLPGMVEIRRWISSNEKKDRGPSIVTTTRLITELGEELRQFVKESMYNSRDSQDATNFSIIDAIIQEWIEEKGS
jgi:Fe-S-cluster formation regulator IscX/YfhJ